jgi:hypothetical protein
MHNLRAIVRLFAKLSYKLLGVFLMDILKTPINSFIDAAISGYLSVFHHLYHSTYAIACETIEPRRPNSNHTGLAKTDMLPNFGGVSRQPATHL